MYELCKYYSLSLLHFLSVPRLFNSKYQFASTFCILFPLIQSDLSQISSFCASGCNAFFLCIVTAFILSAFASFPFYSLTLFSLFFSRSLHFAFCYILRRAFLSIFFFFWIVLFFCLQDWTTATGGRSIRNNARPRYRRQCSLFGWLLQGKHFHDQSWDYSFGELAQFSFFTKIFRLQAV